ncbi:glycogen debranching N-terminal domain-containing protein [Agrococcus sp. Marseille-P2731]|uniref:glycogen debranching N-terminal domain-containing protein n=1 Tax=Agrococcus sp. Marseille-P2731 TaxID=1841862 RepID=UPI0009315F3E|nr:glycogen debranching N-terminal domain-containing protein [Agrococcus sp. Marseille-P2731]
MHPEPPHQEHGRQPLLHDALVVLEAPTQAWSDVSGEMGGEPIDGVFHGDWRYVSGLRLTIAGETVEATGTAATASAASFHGVTRSIDDATPDPRVLVERRREVSAGRLVERVLVRNGLDASVVAPVRLSLDASFAELSSVKAGLPAPVALSWRETARGLAADDGTRSLEVSAPGAAAIERDGDSVHAEWRLEVPPGQTLGVLLELAVADPTAVVGPASRRSLGALSPSGDAALDRWAARAVGDLEALLLDTGQGPFAAAGAPWFMTLFGRDTLITARLLLPLSLDVAVGTLRTLAARQGVSIDPATAEQPGKILHEIRQATFTMPGEGIVLPPVYYGTIDATPLWVILLHEAWRAGLPLAAVRELQPALEAALAWMRDHGSPGDSGFLQYIDETGTGLANQGWKDSGDSIRFRDGSIAEGPIALCEVQAQACQAAAAGAELLEALGGDGDEWRAWAEAMRARFRATFWVERGGEHYPAIALDGTGTPVDAKSSNMGQLLGTTLLSPAEEAHVARLLVDERFASGWGLRTMASDEGGYWPLSYHCGSVWPHDTGVVIEGMLRAGLDDEARVLSAQLVRAADAFGGRLPELFAGFAAAEASTPVAYPASCRPQAWSAAAVVPVHRALAKA